MRASGPVLRTEFLEVGGAARRPEESPAPAGAPVGSVWSRHFPLPGGYAIRSRWMIVTTHCLSASGPFFRRLGYRGRQGLHVVGALSNTNPACCKLCAMSAGPPYGDLRCAPQCSKQTLWHPPPRSRLHTRPRARSNERVESPRGRLLETHAGATPAARLVSRASPRSEPRWRALQERAPAASRASWSTGVDDGVGRVC